MLLPSAFNCDSSQPSQPLQPSRTSHSHLQAALFVSPPASPPTLSSQSAFGNIVTTCRSLQSLITAPVATTTTPPPSLRQLPTPPLAYAPPPLKLRLRSRQSNKTDSLEPDTIAVRRKVVKRTAPRGANKRRRGADDDMGRDDQDSDGDNDIVESQPLPQSNRDHEPAAPSTPKRARIAPEHLPLGLERSDYHHVHLLEGGGPSDAPKAGTDLNVEADGEEWSAEDDRILVELVLEKLKLTKSEWQDCARGLGKDRHNVSRRWKSLIMNGDVGLKTRSSARRTKLHATWR